MAIKSQTTKRLSNKVEVTDPKGINTHIRYSIWYTKGEEYTGKPRGFYITVTPCQVKDGFEIVSAYSGIVSLLLRVQRFNENKLKEIWKTLHTGVDLDVLKNIIARVADAANLQVDLEKLTNE
jgi:hypothetical protein